MSAVEDPASYERLANDVYVHGSVCLALAMATETGMVECLCTADTPLTSTAVAAQLKLKERYVREVLNSLTVGGLVQVEAGTGGREGKEARYWVPDTCRQVLKSYAGFSVAVSTCARQFSEARKCLDLNGPNGYHYTSDGFENLDRIGDVMVKDLSETILETPGLRERLEKGIQAAEVGAGTGWLSLHFAAQFSNSHFTITDPSDDALKIVQERAQEKGLKNVSVKPLDVFHCPEDLHNTFEWVTCMELIHDLPYPAKALLSVAKMLKPGGLFSFVDQFVSRFVSENLKCKESAALYAQSVFLCLPESYQQPDSEALGPCWGTEKAFELIRGAGMTVVGLKQPESLGTLGVCMCEKSV